jgi:ethanolamine utilization protein EutS
MKDEEQKIQRVIQEYVPGKQISLAHLISNPQMAMSQKLGLGDERCGAIGILTITPGEGVIIAADVATKSADVGIVFMDRFSGSLVITGDTASVESGIRMVAAMFNDILHFTVADITRS